MGNNYFLGNKVSGKEMKCIFCKANSENSNSIEHIIPESLGNKSHALPKGIVCDKCNGYFAIKIEKPVLNNEYFKSLRHRNEILNKKNNLPTNSALIVHPKGGKVEIASSKGDVLEVIVPNSQMFDLIKMGEVNKLYIPTTPQPNNNDKLFSRFLGKIAFEAFVAKIMLSENWNHEFVEETGFDCIREYIRFDKGEFWPYHIRRVYQEYDVFIDLQDRDKPKPYQVLHEYDFLVIDKTHVYFVCVIMGVEYTINILERTLEHYFVWLEMNKQKCPLEKDYQVKQDPL